MVLRILAGILLATQPGAKLWEAASLQNAGVALLSLITVIAVMAGFLTTLSAALGAGICFVQWSLTPASSQQFSQALVTSILMGALALTGPGEISLDSRIFGRREITIPVGRRDD